jgi:hypothetical protein
VPHAEHFLERLDRVPRSLSDFALALYRDEERVKWILHYAHLPKEEERVAFALGPDGSGPYIVVTRQGKFVTALGADMTPKNLTVLTRAQVDKFSDRVIDARKRLELAKEIVPDGRQPGDLVGLVNTRAWGLSREEFTAIAGWVPILGVEFVVQIFQAAPVLTSFRESYLGLTTKSFRNNPKTHEGLASMRSLAHGIGAKFALAAMGDLVWVDTFAARWNEEVGPTFCATDQRIFSIAVRGAWAAARIGKPFLPFYKELLSRSDYPDVSFDAVLAVTAIGLRHSHYRQDVRRMVASLVEAAESWNRDWVERLQQWSERAFSDPDGALDDVAAYGRKVMVAVSPLLPEGSRFRAAKEEDVPRETALLCAVNQSWDPLHSFSFFVLPWVAKLASPEELYLPEELEQAMRHVLKRDSMADAYARQSKRAPVMPETRTAPKTGRNEPCSCGSGKKYKKCCGQ